MWPDRRVIDLFGIEHPLILAPMAGVGTVSLAASVCAAGGLGSVGCANLQPERTEQAIKQLREMTDRPININFFCHAAAKGDAQRKQAWRDRLSRYYLELGAGEVQHSPQFNIAPFDSARCDVVGAHRPEVVSFHFGLPEPALLARVKAAGCRVMSSATTVAEARWLEAHGADVIIAQGNEAGGHRGTFLSPDPSAVIASQPGVFALVPQVVDAVKVPVVAAGGIADARGIAAAFALGAAAVQIGTASFCYAIAVKLIVIALLAILVLAAAGVGFSLKRAAKARDANQAYHTTLPKTVILHSISFSTGGDIPASYTCKGEGVSPEISWEGVPDNARSYALVMTDWDVPSPRFRLGAFTHWILYNIPHGVHQIKSAVKTAELKQEKIDAGNNSSDAAAYKPPCPPLGTHRYLFRLYALDVAQIHPSSGGRDSVMEAMRDHVLAFGEIVGLFGG